MEKPTPKDSLIRALDDEEMEKIADGVGRVSGIACPKCGNHDSVLVWNLISHRYYCKRCHTEWVQK